MSAPRYTGEREAVLAVLGVVFLSWFAMQIAGLAAQVMR